ncbi:hypothetical protein D3C73_1585230 [compost metagenome]
MQRTRVRYAGPVLGYWGIVQTEAGLQQHKLIFAGLLGFVQGIISLLKGEALRVGG